MLDRIRYFLGVLNLIVLLPGCSLSDHSSQGALVEEIRDHSNLSDCGPSIGRWARKRGRLWVLEMKLYYGHQPVCITGAGNRTGGSLWSNFSGSIHPASTQRCESSLV